MDALFVEKLAKELNELKGKKVFGLADDSDPGLSLGEFCLKFHVNSQPNGVYRQKCPKKLYLLRRIFPLFIKRVKSLEGERVVWFETVGLSLGGRQRKFHFVAELTGKNANFFVLDEKKKILFQKRDFESTVRHLEVGAVYQEPPLDKKSLSEVDLEKLAPQELYKFVKGLSPLNCKEIALYFERFKSVKRAVDEFLKRHEVSKEAFVYIKDGLPKFLCTFDYESLSGYESVKFGGQTPFLDAWEFFFKKRAEILKERQLIKQRRESLKRAEKRIKDKLKSVESEIKEASRYGEIEKKAELIKQNLPFIKRWQRKLSLTDFETMRQVEVEVEPTLEPEVYMQKLFKEAKKLKRKLKALKEQREKLLRELENLEKQVFKESKEKRAELEKKAEPLKFRFKDLTLLVGRNARQNERVTFQLANPWDVWFHVRGSSGAHVVLKRDRNRKLTQQELELASSAAVYFSKAKDSGKVAVDCVAVKNIKKIPSSRGAVSYSGQKTIFASADAFEKFLRKLRSGS